MYGIFCGVKFLWFLWSKYLPQNRPKLRVWLILDHHHVRTLYMMYVVGSYLPPSGKRTPWMLFEAQHGHDLAPGF